MSTNENLNEIGENHGLAKPEHERPERKNKSFWQRLPLILVLAGFILILFWVVISAYRAQRAARSIASRQDEVKALMENGLLQADPVELEKLVLSTRQDVLDLKSASEPFVRLGPLLSWVPRFGSLLAAGPDLLQMADAGSEAAVYLIKGMQPLFTLVQQNESNPGSLLPSSIDALQAAKPQLALASLSIDRVSEARSRIKKIEDFPEPFTV